MKGEMVKTKVFGSNAPELCAGVDGEDLEGFWLEGFAPPCEEKLGRPSHLLKADRGERAGKYAVIWELPSVASRDRCTLPTGGVSEEGRPSSGPRCELRTVGGESGVGCIPCGV